MLVGLIVCGAVLLAVGFFGLLRPSALQRWVATMAPGKRYVLAVGVRIALGVFLLAVAPEARWPGPTRVLGYIAVLAAVAVGAMGPNRLDRVVQWWSTRPSSALRVTSCVALGLGVLAVIDAL